MVSGFTSRARIRSIENMNKIEFKEAQGRLDGRDIWITPSSYRAMNSRAQFTCAKCGHSWFANCYSVVRQGNGCPKCYAARRAASTKEAMNRPEVRARMSAAAKEAMNRPEVKARHREAVAGNGGWWRAERYRAAGINEIFLYQIEFRIGRTKIYKVGVSKDPRVRLCKLGGYSMQVLSIERGTPEDMLAKERRIKKASKPYLLAEKLPGVNGRTEMFSKLVIPE